MTRVRYINTETDLAENIKMQQIETGSFFQSYQMGEERIEIGWDGQAFIAREERELRKVDPTLLFPLGVQ